MAPKFALFTNGSELPLNQGCQKRFLDTTVSRQALDMFSEIQSIYSDTLSTDEHQLEMRCCTYFNGLALCVGLEFSPFSNNVSIQCYHNESLRFPDP